MKKITLFASTLLLILVGGGIISAQVTNRVTVTIAGNGYPGYNGDGNPGVSNQVTNPYDICMDAANNLYFTDMVNGRVRKIWAKNGMVTTIAGGGTSTADGIPGPMASIMPRNICIDRAGNLYIADSMSHKIRKIDGTTNIITTIAGTGIAGDTGDGGPAIAATLNNVHGICADNSSNIYLADFASNTIRKIDAITGIITTIAGNDTVSGYSGDGGPATAALLFTPTGICADGSGNIYFADQTVGYVTHIRMINTTTGIISNVGGTSTIGGTLYGLLAPNAWLGDVTGLCTDGSGNLFCNEISCSCRRIDHHTDSVCLIAGDFYTESFADCLPSAIAYMNDPYGLCADAVGNVYIADYTNNRIRKVIALTHTPTFAYGEGQLVNICTAGTTTSIDSQLSITDIDSLQTETWTVLTAPANGSLSGLPYSTTSIGAGGVTRTLGATYTPVAGFTGTDSFRVQVSDGTLGDFVTIYVTVGGPGGTVSTSVTGSLCKTMTEYVTENVPGGTWSVSNADASILPSGLLTGITTGTDTITYSINNSCGTASSTQAVSIVDCSSLGVGTVAEAETLTVFPNPATNVLNIKWANWEAQNIIIISDITGREMLRSNLSGAGAGTQQIDVNNLPAGIYLLRVNELEVRKFVKE